MEGITAFHGLRGESMMENMLKEIGHVAVTDRDIEIFKFINEQKYMVASQIYETFWPKSEVSSGTARQRLTKLISAGYIKTIETQKDRKEKLKLFLVTEKAIDVLKTKGLDHGFSEIHSINLYTIEHTLKLGTIRSVLKSMGQNSWRSERIIRKEDANREFYPDAILDFRGHKIAIELENSFREKERYIRRFSKYAKMREFMLVIYIVSWPMVKGWLLDIEAPQNKLGFLLYDEFLNKKENAEIKNKTSKITLGEFFQ